MSYQSKYAFLLRENGKFKENQDSKNSGTFKLCKKTTIIIMVFLLQLGWLSKKAMEYVKTFLG